jgi:hypothetical protein
MTQNSIINAKPYAPGNLSLTSVRRDQSGNWRASNIMSLGNSYEFSITTYKNVSRGLLMTSVSVGKKDGGFITHTMYQDYAKTVFMVKCRVTSKAVEEQHAEALKMLPDFLAEIKAMYGDRITVNAKGEPTNV